MNAPSQKAVSQKAADKRLGVKKALHLLADPSNEFVSTMSRWRDKKWYLDIEQGGSLNWETLLHDGSLLTDAQHAVLLDSMRRYIWSLFVDRIDSNESALSNGANLLSASRKLLSWMVKTYRKDFASLDASAFEDFLDDWVEGARETLDFDDSSVGQSSDVDGEQTDDGDQIIDESGAELSTASFDETFSFNSLYRAVTTWKLIWTQTPVLAKAGVPTMAADPLRNRSVLAVTSEVIAFIVRVTPPLPDEVALPIMNEANRWLGVRADDIIRLHETCMRIFVQSDDSDGGSGITRAQARGFPPFVFSTEPGCSEPWHKPLEVRVLVTKTSTRNVFTRWLPAIEVRELVDSLYGACIIVLNSESAVRPGELRMLRAGYSKSGGHNALREKLSISGLNELFFLDAILKKGRAAGKEEEWLAGSRPTGSDFTPGPVRAIHILESLLKPWRQLTPEKEVKDWLFVNKRSGDSLPQRDSSVVRTNVKTLLRLQRRFIQKHVDLSGLPDRSSLNENMIPYRETAGNCITATQWRKSYAMYVVRTDRRMIQAIALQFKHVSIAMTESAYIGNNASILREAKSQQARAAAAFMYRCITGNEPVAGRVAKLIDEYRPIIARIVGRESAPDGLSNLQQWCAQRGIRAFSGEHGKCFIGIAPAEAQCHQVAGTVSWRNTKPSYEAREPSLCAGCRLFGVDLDHADFWVRRYCDNQTAWLTAKSMGLTKGFRVMQERAAVSANMLRVLQVPLPDIEVPESAKTTL